MSGARFLPGPFRPGDRVQITDPKGRRHTVTLIPAEIFHSHRGGVAHDDIIGQEDGSVVQNSVGLDHLVMRPLLHDFVMSMPRGAAIIYPKDSQAILGVADVFPGARVVEAGVGSGALSLWLLRALAGSGHLYSFERRDEFADVATANVETYFGSRPENWTLTVGDLNDCLVAAIDSRGVDRVILDMLAPWECIERISEVLVSGGVVVCYVATVTQMSRVVERIRSTGRFSEPQSSETLLRTWHVEGLAVRPDHRMVAHTGFLVSARLLAPGAVLPQLKRRASKSDYQDADVDAWTPGSLGERIPSAKATRKRVRQANDNALRATDAHSASAHPSDE